MNNWTTNNIPNQDGKIAIITGGNTGLGFEISKQLARKNATVIIVCRSEEKGYQAIKLIEKELQRPIKGNVFSIDLTNIDSIKSFVSKFKENYSQVDILINNAGVVNLKEKVVTPNGLEMHMATNHLGHFALTGLLYDIIKKDLHTRIVTMSSLSHKYGTINFDDFNWEKRTYDRGKSYGDSKLANLMFMLSLQEKFNNENVNAISVSAHPGLSATERQQTIGIGGWFTKIIAQPVWKGALPAFRAATDSNVKPTEYFGPKYGLRGYPKLSKISEKAFDKTVANKLWKLSEEITGINF